MGAFEENMRREKARALRYKKAMLPHLNLYDIRNWIFEAQEACSEWEYASEENRDALIDAMDGDTEEFMAYQTAFATLSNELERFEYDLENNYELNMQGDEYFDDFLVGIGGDGSGLMLGVDAEEGDYYGLKYDCENDAAIAEAAKRIERMTKKESVKRSGVCMRIALSYMALSHRLDALSAAVNILRSVNTDVLADINSVNEQCEYVADFPRDWEAQRKFDDLVLRLPEEVWLR